MPFNIDITKAMEWFANTDVQLVFPIYEDDDVTPIAQDMPGWAVDWMFKLDIDDLDADAAIHKSGGSVFLGTDPVSGNPAWFVQIDKADTEDIEFGENVLTLSGRHELKRVDSGLNIILSYGRAKLRRPVHAS